MSPATVFGSSGNPSRAAASVPQRTSICDRNATSVACSRSRSVARCARGASALPGSPIAPASLGVVEDRIGDVDGRRTPARERGMDRPAA